MKIDLQRVKELVNNFDSQKVCIIGDCMLDEYLWGEVDRISPEAPVPVVDLKEESLRLGGAANVAWNIGSLNGEPLLMSLIGKDDTGDTFKEELDEFDISTDYLLETQNRPTTLKSRIVAHSQQVVRVDREVKDDIEGEVLERLKEKLLKNLPKFDAVIISDYGKGVITKPLLKFVVNNCKDNGVIVSVDPKKKHFDYYQGVSVITPNKAETENAVGRSISTDEELREAGWEMIEKLDLGGLLITQGKEGMSLFSDKEEYTYLPTVAQDVYDVTGAGDTVVSAFTLVLAAGGTNKEAAYIANHAAGLVVEKFGTATVSSDELIENIVQMDHNYDK